LAFENPDRFRAMMQTMVRELESMIALIPDDGQGREIKPLIP
jgi:hypothetical protein